MREGFYKIDYQGQYGMGFAVLALDTGIVVGADFTGGTYDGTYVWNPETRRIDASVKVHAKAGTVLVQGVDVPPEGLRFEVKCSFPRKPENMLITAETDFGKIVFRMDFLRYFP